jgi:hypothetical protein
MEFTEKEILSALSYEPKLRPYVWEENYNAIIATKTTTKAITPLRKSIGANRQSSLGHLEIMPLEVIWNILGNLDFPSILRFSHISIRGRAVVKSQPEFKQILLSAGHILGVLSKVGVHERFSVFELHAELRSDRCAFCEYRYGDFLFVLLAKRCCYACISRHPALQLMSWADIEDIFSLTLEDMGHLPNIGRLRDGNRHNTFTCVGSAREFAIKEHGGIDTMSAMLNAKLHSLSLRPTWSIRFRLEEYEMFYKASLNPCRRDTFTLPPLLRGWYNSMGAVYFPSISGKQVEKGLYCRGCERSNVIWGARRRSSGPHYSSDSHLCAFSRTEFLEHAKSCSKAREIIVARLAEQARERRAKRWAKEWANLHPLSHAAKALKSRYYHYAGHGDIVGKWFASQEQRERTRSATKRKKQNGKRWAKELASLSNTLSKSPCT